MHIPDGFINAPTSLAAGAVAAGGVGGLPAPRRRTRSQERQVPMAGLVAAFIFAVQMLNFPVANGTSGHLLGGVLAAVLVGPCGCALRRVVLLVQAPAVRRRRPERARSQRHQHGARHRLRRLWVFLLLRRSCRATEGLGRRRAGVAAGLGRAGIARVHPRVRHRRRRRRLRRHGRRRMVGVHVLIGIGEGIITAPPSASSSRCAPTSCTAPPTWPDARRRRRSRGRWAEAS